MWCRVAWADGVLHSVELDVIVNLFERIGAGSLTAEEFEMWIFEPPELEEQTLPSHLKRLFVHEALQIAAADGEVGTRELEVVRNLLHRCFPEAGGSHETPESTGGAPA